MEVEKAVRDDQVRVICYHIEGVVLGSTDHRAGDFLNFNCQCMDGVHGGRAMLTQTIIRHVESQLYLDSLVENC